MQKTAQTKGTLKNVKPKSRTVFLRVSEKIWEKIEAEMRDKDLTKPQPIVLSALRTRYGLKEI